MRCIRILSVAFLLVVACTTTGLAQLRYGVHPDVAAAIADYENGAFIRAYRALKPFVLEPAIREPERTVHRGVPNVWAALYVARMSRDGLGTDQDRIYACGLMMSALVEFSGLEIDPKAPLTSGARDEMRTTCAGLDDTEVGAVMSSCRGAEGPRPLLEFVTSAGVPVRVDRVGVHVYALTGSVTYDDIPRRTCSDAIAELKHTQVEVVEADRARIRDFLEVFSWTPLPDSTSSAVNRTLMWYVLELTPSTLAPRASMPVTTVRSATRLERGDFDLRGLTELTGDGSSIRWRVTVDGRTGRVD